MADPVAASPASAPPVRGAGHVVASAEVRDALGSGMPVVALESTILAHGLPAPANRSAADEIEAAVRSAGAVPALQRAGGGASLRTNLALVKANAWLAAQVAAAPADRAR